MLGASASNIVGKGKLEEGYCADIAIADIDNYREVVDNEMFTYNIVGKGKLEEGYCADIAIADTDSYREVMDDEMFTKVRWSPFRGKPLTGWPLWTIVGGNIAFSDNRIQEDVRGSPIVFENSNYPECN